MKHSRSQKKWKLFFYLYENIFGVYRKQNIFRNFLKANILHSADRMANARSCSGDLLHYNITYLYATKCHYHNGKMVNDHFYHLCSLQIRSNKTKLVNVQRKNVKVKVKV